MKDNQKGLKVILKYPGFIKLWLGGLISRLGDSIDAIAFMWMIYQLTDSSLLMGTIMAVNFLPNVIFGFFSGVLVDRWNKKKIMLFGDIGRGLGVAVIALLYITGNVDPIYLYIITFINSTLETFASTARLSVIPRLITDEDDFLAANGLFKATSSFAEIIGLGLAGVIVGFGGVGMAIIIDSVSFFICAGFIFLVHIPASQKELDDEQINLTNFKRDFLEGLRAIFKKPAIRICVFLSFIINLAVSPFNVLAPIYADNVLGGGPESYSMLALFLSIGMLIGSLLIGQFGKKFGYKTLIVTGILGMSLGFSGFYLVFNFYLAVLAAFILGVGVSVLSSSVTTVIMSSTPKDILGRVGSVMGSLSMAAMPAGTAIAGAIAERFQSHLVFFWIGILLGIVTVLVAIRGSFTTPSKQDLATA